MELLQQASKHEVHNVLLQSVSVKGKKTPLKLSSPTGDREVIQISLTCYLTALWRVWKRRAPGKSVFALLAPAMAGTIPEPSAGSASVPLLAPLWAAHQALS